jgi:hypothetical protein
MMMQRLVLLALASASCSEHAPSWYGVTDGKLSEATTTDASTSFTPDTDTAGEIATTGGSPTSSAGFTTSGVTADASTGDAGSSSTGAPVDDPPQVFAFTVETNNDTPGQIFEAGEVQLDLQVSDDVVEVDIMYGDTLVATVPIVAFPYLRHHLADHVRRLADLRRDRPRRWGADGHGHGGPVLPAPRAWQRGIHAHLPGRRRERRGCHCIITGRQRDRCGRAGRAHGALAPGHRGQRRGGLAEDPRRLDDAHGSGREGVERHGRVSRWDRRDLHRRHCQEWPGDVALPRQAERPGREDLGGPRL